MSIAIRLKSVMNEQSLTSYALNKKTGVAVSTIDKIIKGESKNPSISTLTLLANTLNVSKKWLFSGEGSMHLPNSDTINYPFESEKDGNSQEMEPIKAHDYTGYYYPDVSASAGLDASLENSEFTKIPVNIPFWGKGLDFISIYGDSMYPKFCAGEVIGIKKIEPEYLVYGFAYVLVFQNGDVHVKYIKKGKNENYILLESENKFYEAREFHLNKIKSIYQIKGVLTKVQI